MVSRAMDEVNHECESTTRIGEVRPDDVTASADGAVSRAHTRGRGGDGEWRAEADGRAG